MVVFYGAVRYETDGLDYLCGAFSRVHVPRTDDASCRGYDAEEAGIYGGQANVDVRSAERLFRCFLQCYHRFSGRVISPAGGVVPFALGYSSAIRARECEYGFSRRRSRCGGDWEDFLILPGANCRFCCYRCFSSFLWSSGSVSLAEFPFLSWARAARCLPNSPLT